MSLTSEDFYQIRTIFKEEIDSAIKPIKDELEALNNDIKEIYQMLSDRPKKHIKDSNIISKTLEEKLLKLNSELIAAAKQAGITLPRA